MKQINPYQSPQTIGYVPPRPPLLDPVVKDRLLLLGWGLAVNVAVQAVGALVVFILWLLGFLP